MPYTQIKIYRDKLYKEIWNEPMIVVAKRYFISDVGLKKMCKRLDIPSPPRGYWAKKAFKKKLQQTPLPKEKINIPSYIFHSYETSPSCLPDTPILDKFLPKLELEAAMFEFNPDTKRFPLLKGIKTQFIAQGKDDYNVLHNPKLGIRVSPNQLERALTVLDNLFSLCSKLGLIPSFGDESLHICVNMEKVTLKIYEKVDQSRVETKERNYPWGQTSLLQFEPTGRLFISIVCWSYSGKKTWSDISKKNLESQLVEIVSGIIQVAAHQKAVNDKKEKQEQEEQRLQKEAETKKLAEEFKELKIKDIETKAQNWQMSKLLTDYLNSVQKALVNKNLSIEDEKKFKEWTNLVKERIEELNPINHRSFLDEPQLPIKKSGYSVSNNQEPPNEYPFWLKNKS